MSYVLINYAEDGTHNRVFRSEKAALKALADFLGYEADEWGPLHANRAYVSDWGNRLIVEERRKGHNARTEAALHAAYNARECGTATKRQLALLAKHLF